MRSYTAGCCVISAQVVPFVTGEVTYAADVVPVAANNVSVRWRTLNRLTSKSC